MNDGSDCKKWHFVGFSRIRISSNNEQVYLWMWMFYCRILASVISAASWNLTTMSIVESKMKWQKRTCVSPIKWNMYANVPVNLWLRVKKWAITCENPSEMNVFRIDWFFSPSSSCSFYFGSHMASYYFRIRPFFGVWEQRKREIFVAFYHRQTKSPWKCGWQTRADPGEIAWNSIAKSRSSMLILILFLLNSIP